MKRLSLILFIASAASVMFSSYVANAHDYAPHFGNIEVKTCDDYTELQNTTHVYGSVIISGRMMLCDDRVDALNLGRLKYISGFLYITLNPYLKMIDAPELLHASYIVFSGNPMLTTGEADTIGNQVHCGGGISCIESGHYSEQLGAP